MPGRSTDQDLEALREQIRRAGERSRFLRELLSDRQQHSWPLRGSRSDPITTLLTLLLNWRFRRQLKKALAALDYRQQVELLVPLEADDCSDTRNIVAPFLRGLRIDPTELTSAEPKGGRGSEVGAGEEAGSG